MTLVLLTVLAALEWAKESSSHHLILYIPMQLFILSLLALHRTHALDVFPFSDAVCTKSSLALCTFDGVQQDFHTDHALKIALIIFDQLGSKELTWTHQGARG